jgi:hypothetical protein
VRFENRIDARVRNSGSGRRVLSGLERRETRVDQWIGVRRCWSDENLVNVRFRLGIEVNADETIALRQYGGGLSP